MSEILLLASESAIRQHLLTQAGIRFVSVPSHLDEEEIRVSATQEGLNVMELSVLLAEMKAYRVSFSATQNLVLGADQLLEYQGQYMSKPTSLERTKEQLWSLRGEVHKLICSAVFLRDGQRLWHHTSQATLRMRMFSETFLDEYLQECGETLLTTVGGYQIEGRGIQLFQEIKGDLFTVMGLPLLPILDFLRVQGIVHT